MSKWIAEFELEDGDTMPEHMDLEYMGAKIDFHCKPFEQEPVLDKIFNIIYPLSIMSTSELEHKAIMQIAKMLEPLFLSESEE